MGTSMFRKLLANLPFNPGLLPQVSELYGHLRRETSLRGWGLMILAAALAMQVAAITYPSHNAYVGTSSVEATGSKKPPAKLELSKSVENVTRGIWDARGTTAKSGDVLEFKIVTKNIGGKDYQNYQGQDYFGKVLQYADVLDISQLNAQGLSLSTSGNLTWSTASIKAGASDTLAVRVKVKSPVPATNKPSVGSSDYNCQINNFYGNQISLNVDCPVVKTIAETATSLPKTGPSASMIIGTAVAVLAGYLYARSRIMAKELAIVRRDYISSGDDS